MNANNRATVIADSTHYQEAFLRLKETYDYAESRYRELERYVFVDGQTPFLDILANPGYYWNKVKVDLRGQYSMKELRDGLDESELDENASDEENDTLFLQHLSSKAENALLLFVCVIQLVVLAFFWLLTLLILWLLYRFTRLKRYVPKKKLSIISILMGTIAYFLMFGFSLYGDEYINLGVRHVNTFLWLLIAISGSLLLRVKPDQFRQGFLLYSATFLVVLMIIACRITFMSDKLMVFLFPPILLLIVVWQLCCCIWLGSRATPIDRTLGWVSLAVYFVAFVFAFLGYTFVALLILVWWYFRPNEINLSLGNSIISVLIWMGFAVVVISVWKIPTGSLGLIAGGFVGWYWSCTERCHQQLYLWYPVDGWTPESRRLDRV